MKIVGLITEYNPFHNGHKYHIERALEMTGADLALVVMSGDFVQRGAPAIAPKHLRTETALKNGAAVVMELPVRYATGSAEYFAEGAVTLLHKLGCVDFLCFGSECGDIHMLNEIASIFATEPAAYRLNLQECLRQGASFPMARQNALLAYTENAKLAEVLSKPNNTLGIEYLKALIRLSSSIQPFTIQRLGADYHEDTLHAVNSSASAIRNQFSKSDFSFDSIYTHIPESTNYLLEKHYLKRFPLETGDFSLLLKYKLLSETSESLLSYADITEELANRIIKYRNQFLNWEQFCELLKTKETTYSRISRILLHVLLGIRSYHSKEIFYARILGFQREHSHILRELKASSSVPLITKLANTSVLSESGIQMLDEDLFASDLYESVIANKYQRPFINEYQKQLVII